MPSPSWFNEKAIGRRLREVRGARTQADIGGALGYLQPHLSRYERGEIPGSFRFLAGLAALFDVDLTWVLTGRGAARARSSDARAVFEEPMQEALRRLQVVEEKLDGSHSPALGCLEGSWDQVQVELPLILAPLLSKGALTSSGAAPSLSGPAPGRPGAAASHGASTVALDGASAEGDAAAEQAREVDPQELLSSLRWAARGGDLAGVLERLTLAAKAMEDGDPSLLGFERARFLLLWAWLIAESAAGKVPEKAPSAPLILFRLARATRKTGRLEEAERIYLAARSGATDAGDWEIAARCHAGLGNLYLERGDFPEARRQYVALLEEALRLGDPRLLFRAYLNLSAYTHEHDSAYEKAADYARAGLEIARRESDLEHVGRFLNELGLSEMKLGNLQAAEASFEEALELADRLGSPLLSASGRINLGELRLWTGSHEEAGRLLREGRAVAARAGFAWAECQAEILLARVDEARGRTAGALERLERVEDRCAASGLSHERDLARTLEREIRRGMILKIEGMTA